MPGMGEAIEGAMQQAPQPGRQSIGEIRRQTAGQCAGSGQSRGRNLRGVTVE